MGWGNYWSFGSLGDPQIWTQYLQGITTGYLKGRHRTPRDMDWTPRVLGVDKIFDQFTHKTKGVFWWVGPPKNFLQNFFFTKFHSFGKNTNRNQPQNFEKHMKQKRCAIRRLNVPNFFGFWKKLSFDSEKRKKLSKKCNYRKIRNCCLLFIVFCNFLPLNLIFFKNKKKSEHLNLLWRIFFTSGVFQNFEVDFWPLLKAEKVRSRSRFWRENFFSLKFYFLSSIWTYKLLFSRIPSVLRKKWSIVTALILLIKLSCFIWLIRIGTLNF